MDQDFFEAFKEYALNSRNYKKWRKTHSNMFGNIFAKAFEGNNEAQIHLTAALIDISQRNFEKARPKLGELACICGDEFDLAAVNYFTGLNYEMLEDADKMSEYYDALLDSGINIEVQLSFRPYYRTAKFAQHDSECSKAIHYYKKALTFFEDKELSPLNTEVAGYILYDIATVYMYRHQYDQAERFVELSRQFSKSKNQQRDYIAAILHALQGNIEECNVLLADMSVFLRENCQAIVTGILSGTDPHYCVVPQERTFYSDFSKSMLCDQEDLREQIIQGDFEGAENRIGEKLTKALPFMKRKLVCRIEMQGNRMLVKCKNYHVKSLMAEHKVLFSTIRDLLPNWTFVSVNEFECF